METRVDERRRSKGRTERRYENSGETERVGNKGDIELSADQKNEQ